MYYINYYNNCAGNNDLPEWKLLSNRKFQICRFISFGVNKVSFGNSFAPVCIDWYSKYDMKNEAQLKVYLFYYICI